ncbi:MAG TPA: serine protease [Hyphomicrobiaceae bacterium]|jgi:hypothetical protein|nr:serine protease [Hyphomicrobiaceae bacterium]
MRRLLLSLLSLVGLSSSGAAACIDPATLVRSTVSITREFDAEERQAAPAVLGIRGTGWFLSPRLVVTAAHVVEAMRLSAQDWKDIALLERENETPTAARILRLAGSHSEKMAVLELRAAVAGAVALPVRAEPLVPEERLLSLAYPNGKLRFANGRFERYGTVDKLAGAALIEMHDGNDRLVLDHGASGAPVLDCDGRVVAVVSTLFTQTLSLPSGAVRVSTAWQTPNVLSIPAGVLKDFSWSE